MKDTQADIAIIGLGTMGRALARNMENHGYHVAVYNRTSDKTDSFIETYKEKQFTGTYDYATLAASLKRPRKIMMLIKAGEPVDETIADLLPYLEKDDIIIDGGNSHYSDTQRREKTLREKGIHFVGCGVSGGEEGALHGPSLMPGGSEHAWTEIKPIYEAIAAKDFSGGPCVTHVGADGAGHYVKMVHNGIEYGIMQIIAEIYDIFSTTYEYDAPAIAKIFSTLNDQPELESFLFEITTEVLSKKDKNTDKYLIDLILDKAAQKGTGQWTSQDALARGVAVPTITEAVYARYISGEKPLRVKLGDMNSATALPMSHTDKEIIALLPAAVKIALISTYAQGYALISRAAKEENWAISLPEVSRIWEGGCIIRSRLLEHFQTGLTDQMQHIFSLPSAQESIAADTPALRTLVMLGAATGTPVPALSTALSYIDSMTREHLPANMIQGLRDRFGAHTFERTDASGSFHADW